MKHNTATNTTFPHIVLSEYVTVKVFFLVAFFENVTYI